MHGFICQPRRSRNCAPDLNPARHAVTGTAHVDYPTEIRLAQWVKRPRSKTGFSEYLPPVFWIAPNRASATGAMPQIIKTFLVKLFSKKFQKTVQSPCRITYRCIHSRRSGARRSHPRRSSSGVLAGSAG